MAIATNHQLTDTKIDVLCAVAEAAADRRDAPLRDVAACCPTVPEIDPVLRALHNDGLVALTATTAGLTGRGGTVCLHL